MYTSLNTKAYIKAISYYLPEKVYTNSDFYKDFPESHQNKDNLDKIGVQKRHIVKNNETASDIAVKSAEHFFKEHGVKPEEIDFLLFCAQEFDHYTPTTACIIQDRLNLPKTCGALDYNLGCSGFVYGLSLAKGLIESVGLKNVLLITSSTITKKVHPKDKSLKFIFGDGAATTLISAGKLTSGIGEFVFGTDGSGKNKIIIKDGGARNPITEKSVEDFTDEYGNTTNGLSVYMNGTGVFIFGLKTVPKIIMKLLEKENKTLESIDLFIFHQANLFLIDSIRKKLKIPEQKTFNFMENVGNTVSSSIPIALYEAIKCGKAKKGNTIVVVGFGVGLSWAATTIKL